MNGAFRHEPLPVFGDRLGNIRSWWQRCSAVKADGFLVTSWESYRLALETTTVVDAAAASLWLEPAADDGTTLLAHGLARVFPSINSRAVARSLLAADEHAFAGYARWQINDRWDVFAGNESVKPYQAEERFFSREQARARREKWPVAITASLAFRHYLAQRDVFKWRRLLAKHDTTNVISYMTLAGVQAGQFAQAVKAGRLAARAMWGRTRDPQVKGQDETMLAADEKRLMEWRAWLRKAVRQPELIWPATPVCGAWQLQFMVHNFAPAVQKVVVEQQNEDDSWRELASRFTIEFRAYAARPHTKIKREFTVPVASPDDKLRIAVHGTGQVAISHVLLTNGVKTQPVPISNRKKVLGRRAPKRGLPCLGIKSDPRVLKFF